MYNLANQKGFLLESRHAHSGGSEMSLDSLCELIEAVRLKSKNFETMLSKSEALTRYVFIDLCCVP